ncbi:MAG: hypothetical protein IBJ10_08395, partial [Phycisphaerales bacterium]|nr:hypothetical protein [Phycisphaerales bacterium]
ALARALTLGKFPDEARAALEERTAADAGPEVWTDLIGLDMNGMDLQRADRNLQLALKAHPEDARLQMLRSVLDLAMGKGDSAAALAQINQALKDADASPELRELGEILSRHGSPGADRAELTRELAILTTRRPTFFTAWRLLISAYMEDGRVIEAAAAGRAAAAAMPNDPRTLRLATEAIAGARLFPEALSTAESWRRVARDDRAEASLAVAQLRATLGQPEEGLIILEPMREAIIAQAEANPQMLTTYAGLLAATGRSREADALLRDSAGADASWALRYITIAEAMTGRPSDARAWLDQCAALVERRAEAAAPLGAQWRALAAATEEPADFAQAARWLSKAVQERPTALTLVALADCQAAAGDATGAEASYRQALTLREDPIAMNNFAGMLAKVRPGDDEARRLATRAIALARAAKVPPDSLARFIDTLGFAELRAGRHAEAIAAFDEALTLDPLLADSAVGKAEALLGKGDKAGAEASLRSLGEKNLRLSRDLAERVQAIRDSLTAGRI